MTLREMIVPTWAVAVILAAWGILMLRRSSDILQTENDQLRAELDRLTSARNG